MFRHIALTLAVTIAALTAGIYMVPGTREQWTMLIRDERNAEALALLDQKYQAGERDPEAMLQLYKLLMSFAQIERATRIIEEVAARRPDDVSGLAMLAKHYGDTQDTRNETSTLERMFALQPSSATAQRLLVLYRLGARPADERRLMAIMLADSMITADDAERLGFMLAADGDFQGARQALSAFDAMARPDRSTGRFALFDVLLRLGEPKAAMAMAEHWLSQWHRARLNRGLAGRDFPLDRLIQLMAHVDQMETRRIICTVVPDMPRLDPDAMAAQLPICTQPQQADGSVDIDGEDVEGPSVIITTKGDEGDRSSR